MNPQNYYLGGNLVSRLCLYTIFLLFSIVANISAQQLAFPSAIGAGAYTTGGRGGQVIKVTNLNDSGSGSLRSALLATYPRIIVFDVSGTIVLNSMIELGEENSNFTVAGQTAPEGGITIAGKPIKMGGGYYLSPQACNNAVWRYIRFRNGSYNGISDEYFHNGFISNGTKGLIFDHCSFSFCDDQAISMTADWAEITDITIQKCVFSENATGIVAGVSMAHPTGDMTLAYNLFVDQGHRTPNMGGIHQFDVVNNVIFNWGSRLSTVGPGSPDINYLGNYLKPGAYSDADNLNKSVTSCKIFTSDNYHPIFYPDPQNNDRNIWQYFTSTNTLGDNYFVENQFSLLGIAPNIYSAQDAYSYVLNDVGTNKFLNADGTSGIFQDSFDVLKISNVLNNVSSDPFNKNWTLPNVPNNSRPSNYDSNDDGMPDEWKLSRGFGINDDLSTYVWPSGYIGVEEFLNEIDLGTVDNNVYANAGADQSICEGESATLTATGGTEYLWSTGETTQSITVSPATTTTYSVTVSNDSGSEDSDEVTVTVNALPVADAGSDEAICEGDSVTLTASGGSNYQWSTGATTQSITVSPSNTTTYSVDVTDNGCTTSDNVTVVVNALPDVSAGADITINYGESTTLNATGADTYQWSTGATTQSIEVSPTETTTYTVTGTTNGCSSVATVIVSVQSETVTANAGADQSICEGESATLTATGGTEYLWSTGETTQSITVSPDTTTSYSVTVSNDSGSEDTDEVTVTVNALPVADAGSDEEICEGDSVTLTASGGSNYQWSTGATSQSITVSPSNTTTYSVDVTDNGCTTSDDVTIVVNALLDVSAGADITINFGESTTLNATGADTYQWNTGATTQSIEVSPTETTTYSVTGTTNSCSSVATVIVSVQSEEVTANAGADQSICEGDSATLTATGGTEYLWNTGETTASITVSPATTTTYSVTVSNDSGSEDTDEVTVTVNALPVADAGSDEAICEGESVTLTASGGSNYQWNTGATSQSITVSPSNTTTYSVDVTDNGCTTSDDVTVVVNALLDVSAGADITINYGESTTLNATGADTYQWSTGATTQSIEVSPTETTTYTVTGTTNSCSNESSVTVIVINNVQATVSENQRVCDGYGYEITLTASGGESYLWSTGETTESIVVSPLSTTTYSVIVYQGNEQDEASVTVFVDPNPNVIVNSSNEDFTILDGEYITLSASGANDYAWNNGATEPNIAVNPSTTTIYEVTGYINDCYDTKEVMVNVVPQVDANVEGELAICLAESTVLTASGGDEYMWNTGETTQSITVAPTQNTEYSVTVFNELDYDEATVIVEVDTACEEILVENPEFDFRVFPNPAEDELNIKLTGLYNTSKLYLYDVSGKVLFSDMMEETVSGDPFTKKLNLTNLNAGLYILKIEYDGKDITEKVIIN